MPMHTNACDAAVIKASHDWTKRLWYTERGPLLVQLILRYLHVPFSSRLGHKLY